MPFASARSTLADSDEAVRIVVDEIASELEGGPADLGFLFVSHEHVTGLDDLLATVGQRLEIGTLIGCTGEAIVAGDEEYEQGPALTLWAGSLPGADLRPFRLDFERTPDGILCSGLPEGPGRADESVRAIFYLGEPFSSVPQSVIDGVGREFPGVPLLGGMASGGAKPDENRLVLGGEVVAGGGVGVVVRGGPRIRSIVSQGCRPIDQHFVVTKAEENVIEEIGGEPPVVRLQQILPELSERDQILVSRGLHVGLALNEYQDSFGRGDFLIANVLGADRQTGSIAIGSQVRVGQTVQFHVRDGETAHDNLVEMLERDRERHDGPPQAALLFSCNGRGTRLFREPNHDAQCIQREFGPLPLAGFFAQGEFGPVGGRNFIHGYTASVALFE